MIKQFALRLVRFAFHRRSPAAFFDADWYLDTYHDVKASGINPWVHFDRYGCNEGRFACQAHAEIWTSDSFNLDMPDMLSTKAQNYWAWLSGRWYAKQNNWFAVYQAMQSFNFELERFDPYANLLMPGVLWYEALVHQGKATEAALFLSRLQRRYKDASVFSLLAANSCLLDQAQASTCWLDHVNSIYRTRRLSEISLNADQLAFDALMGVEDTSCNSRSDAAEAQGMVSIIIPAYNSERTLPTVLKGLMAQSWKNLDILVVDDASTDNTCGVAESFAKLDSRIRLLRSTHNQGPYVARNQGLHSAQGDFITIHDADDWSHPQKIELQVLPLLSDRQKQATQSYWARLTDGLCFGRWQTPSSWTSWCHRNTSSLLFRRSVVEQLGYWDPVSCNADMEYYHRILRVYGADSIQDVYPDVPLSMGRMSSGSITQRSETSIFSIFSGARCDYTRAYMEWHANTADVQALYLPFTLQQRPFAAPDVLLKR